MVSANARSGAYASNRGALKMHRRGKNGRLQAFGAHPLRYQVLRIFSCDVTAADYAWVSGPYQWHSGTSIGADNRRRAGQLFGRDETHAAALGFGTVRPHAALCIALATASNAAAWDSSSHRASFTAASVLQRKRCYREDAAASQRSRQPDGPKYEDPVDARGCQVRPAYFFPPSLATRSRCGVGGAVDRSTCCNFSSTATRCSTRSTPRARLRCILLLESAIFVSTRLAAAV